MKVQGREVLALIDTGAQVTVLNQNIADSMRLSYIATLRLNQAIEDGGEAQEFVSKFCPEVTYQMGKSTFKWHVCVAPIGEELILGCDFLQEYVSDISISKSALMINGEFFPYIKRTADVIEDYEISNIKLNADITIPPLTGKILKVPIKSKVKGWKMLEPAENQSLFTTNAVFHAHEKRVKFRRDAIAESG